MRDSLKMTGVDASQVIAEMVHIETLGNRPNDHLIGDPMGIGEALPIPENRIAIAVDRPEPFPAARTDLDLVPQPTLKRGGKSAAPATDIPSGRRSRSGTRLLRAPDPWSVLHAHILPVRAGVRRAAKPLFSGSNPLVASTF